MERQLCRDAILPMPAICEVPCPKDCALSPWTPWSLCSHTCSGKNTEGRQTRARSILAYNAGEGRSSFIKRTKQHEMIGGSSRRVVWRIRSVRVHCSGSGSSSVVQVSPVTVLVHLLCNELYMMILCPSAVTAKVVAWVTVMLGKN